MGETSQNGNDLPHSYHTFIYPFSYEAAKDGVTLDSYIDARVSRKEGVWRKKENSREDDVLRYNAYQYLLPKARNILFSDAKNAENLGLMDKYVYDLGDNAEIRITLDAIEPYKLSINQISLELVKEHQIGILTFELENYDTPSEEEIIKINEYGRRVFAPCLKKEGEELDSFLTAKSLEISGVHVKSSTVPALVIDFNKEFKNGISKLKPTISLAENIIFEGTPEDKWENCILPVLDDRMYAVCLMRKLNYSPIAREFGEYRYLRLQQYAEQLYKFVFLESKEPQCQNVDMMREKLEEHIYRRWTDWGTVYGVTEYSCVCVTGDDPELKGSVINPFLTIYVPMVKLVLLQRSAITRMEQEAQEISRDLDKGKGSEIKKLWQKYVLFQNTLLIPQATFQEQGVEVYEMLLKFLKIREMNAYLEDELKNLFNYARIEKDEQEKEQADNVDRKINFLTLVGTVLAIFSLMQDIYGSLTIQLFDNGHEYGLELFRMKGILYATAAILVIASVVLAQRKKVLSQKKRWMFIMWILFVGVIAAALLAGLVYVEYCIKGGI